MMAGNVVSAVCWFATCRSFLIVFNILFSALVHSKKLFHDSNVRQFWKLFTKLANVVGAADKANFFWWWTVYRRIRRCIVVASQNVRGWILLWNKNYMKRISHDVYIHNRVYTPESIFVFALFARHHSIDHRPGKLTKINKIKLCPSHCIRLSNHSFDIYRSYWT